jgi:hypothetical protein
LVDLRQPYRADLLEATSHDLRAYRTRPRRPCGAVLEHAADEGSSGAFGGFGKAVGLPSQKSTSASSADTT